MNMKNCGRRHVRKHREIKGSDKYVTLDILLKFSSPENMRIKSSDPNNNLGKPGKELIISPGIKAKSRPKKSKKKRYVIGNVSNKDLSKIIREFDKLPYKSYERSKTELEHTDSYFYLSG